MALLEQHDLIPEEVAAEFDYLMELDSPEETEQVCVGAECLLVLRSSCMSAKLSSLTPDDPFRMWLIRGRHNLGVEIAMS